MDANFYAELKPFSSFHDLTDPKLYVEVPSTWWVIITDIKGSTRAIQEGRYRDVNSIGAACIVVILNKCNFNQIPFVFGGDGATLLVPDSAFEIAKQELSKVAGVSMKNFGLELRLGAVRVSELGKKNQDLRVAKYELVAGQAIAMFQGGGLKMAEDMVKSGSREAVLWSYQTVGGDPALNGLSCRWDPLRTRRGKIISLLVQSRIKGSVGSQIYSQILELLTQGRPFSELAPVREQNLTISWPLSGWKTEWRFKGAIFLRYLVNFWIYLLFKTNLSLGSFRMGNYQKEIPEHSDYKKFDETLRMVVDVSESELSKLRTFLDQALNNGQIFYGLHVSEEALMTCFVKSPTVGQHIHFIDGGGGGYAIAAQGLKAQIKASID